MKKSHLLGALCICVIALVGASMSANTPVAPDLLNAVLIISCVVLAVVLLRGANSGQTRVVRRRGSRRCALAAGFPLTDSQGVLVIEDRRRLPDRRKAGRGSDNDAKVVPFKKLGSN